MLPDGRSRGNSFQVDDGTEPRIEQDLQTKQGECTLKVQQRYALQGESRLGSSLTLAPVTQQRDLLYTSFLDRFLSHANKAFGQLFYQELT